MIVLFTGALPILAGPHEFGPFAVPGGIKQPDAELTLRITIGADTVPAGTTRLTMFLSTDGGATYRSASMDLVSPRSWRGAAPHFEVMGYFLGVNDSPTHAKFSTDAPSAFTTTFKLEAM